jgi:hypothetical protein
VRVSCERRLPFLELAARGSLALTGELPPAYAGQVKPGLKVAIYDEVTGIRATGMVADLGTPTTTVPAGTIVAIGGGSDSTCSTGSAGSGSSPSVGRPPPPSSGQAALSRMAFTPYAALGESNNDGLAPGASDYALAQACLTAAGYPDLSAGDVPFSVTGGPANLAFAQPWGAWGYLGSAEATQYGFRVPAGSALTSLGIDVGSGDPASLPQAEQAVINTCYTIAQDFGNAEGQGPLAGIATLSSDIASDVQADAAVKNATGSWTTCMARNGYHLGQPDLVFRKDRRGRHRRHLHQFLGPGRDLLRRPGQLRAASRQRQPAGPHHRGPAVPRRLRQGTEEAP